MSFLEEPFDKQKNQGPKNPDLIHIEDSFRWNTPGEQINEVARTYNAAGSVITAYESRHPEAAQQVFRLRDTQLADLTEQLRGAELVASPSEELYWTAREYLERRIETSHLPSAEN
jgi:hypothetical protein